MSEIQNLMLIFAEEKVWTMKKDFNDYDRFIAAMTDGMLYINPSISFHLACLLLGADEKALGDIVLDETGFTLDDSGNKKGGSIASMSYSICTASLNVLPLTLIR